MALYIESLYSYIRDISTIISTYVGTLEKTKEDIVEDSSVSSVVECRARFYANIQNTLKDIYKALNLSAVSGEYVNKIDFETILEDISTNVGEIITLLPDQVAEEESKTLMNTVNCIVIYFYIIVKIYILKRKNFCFNLAKIFQILLKF